MNVSLAAAWFHNTKRLPSPVKGSSCVPSGYNTATGQDGTALCVTFKIFYFPLFLMYGAESGLGERGGGGV